MRDWDQTVLLSMHENRRDLTQDRIDQPVHVVNVKLRLFNHLYTDLMHQKFDEPFWD
jgi:hypothetical protein